MRARKADEERAKRKSEEVENRRIARRIEEQDKAQRKRTMTTDEKEDPKISKNEGCEENTEAMLDCCSAVDRKILSALIQGI